MRDVAVDGNPGLTKATEAAQAVAGLLVVPDFGENRDPAWTDFNDLAVHQGTEVVAECIRRQVESGAGEGVPKEDEGSGNDETGSSSSGQDGKGGDHATGDAVDLEATVRRLAGLSPIEYDRERKAKAKQLGVRVATLDAKVEKLRRKLAGNDNDSQKAKGVKTSTEPGLTDLGNAHRFAREHQTDTRYCWPWQKWLIWNGRFWAHDDSGAVHRLAEQTVGAMYTEAGKLSMPRREALGRWALKSEAHDRRAKMLASGQAIAGIPVRPAELDRDPWLLNVRNGTLDLRTGTLRPHERKDYITLGLDLDYDPDAKCPTWESFLSDVFAGVAETIAFLQRAIGHSLTGDVREDAFFILYGAGSNGKSTLINIVHVLLGLYAAKVPSELLMVRRGERHPTELATLYQKRFVSASETSQGCRLNEAMVKSLTSSDPIPCRRMKEDFWTFWPTHKMWLSTNHRPQIRGTDHGIWRRIHLIPFGVKFHEPETKRTPQKDTKLPGRLLKELPGILAWVVRGCLDWQREGLKPPKTVRDATEGYRAEMDVLAAFLKECCVFDKGAKAGATALYEAYKRWCGATGEPAESQKSFGKRLGELGLTSRVSYGRTVYDGIGLSAGDDGDDGDLFSSSYTRKKSHTVNRESRSPSSPSSPEDRHCWSCRGAIDDEDAKRCESCGWFVCQCGACGCSRT